MLDFDSSLNGFLDALFSFITELLNAIFGALTEFLGGINISF